MVEYRRSAHAVTDLKYHVIWVTKYRYKILRGDIVERARELLRQILCSARSDDHSRCGVTGPHPYAGGGPAAAVAVETGAVPEGVIVALAPTGVSGVAQAVLGAASVGARVLRCECRGGGRTNDPGVYRESTVGRECRGLHDHRTDRALSRRGSRCLQAASAAPRLSVDLESTAFRR